MASELVVILEKEASAEIERILAEARTQVEQIVARATEEAQASLSAQREQLEMERRAALIRAQSAAQVRGAALVLQAKDQTLTKVFSAAESELVRLQQDRARYGKILRGMIKEGASGLSGRITVEANPNDLDVVRQAVRDVKVDSEVKAASALRGGVRLISDDGRFVVENTLESRLERVKPLLAPDIAALLWG